MESGPRGSHDRTWCSEVRPVTDDGLLHETPRQGGRMEEDPEVKQLLPFAEARELAAAEIRTAVNAMSRDLHSQIWGDFMVGVGDTVATVYPGIRTQMSVECKASS